MKKQSRDKFEEAWAEAFEGAALKPTEHVWDKVELSIANSANNASRKRLLVFKLLAAASISFALSIGGWQLYNSYYINTSESLEALNMPKEVNGNDDAELKTNDGTKSKANSLTKEAIKREILSEDEESILNQTSELIVSNETNQATELSGNESYSEARQNLLKQTDNELLIVNSTSLNADNGLFLEQLESLKGLLDLREPKAVDLHMVPWLSNTSTNKVTSNYRKLWTGLGMSAGNFNPNSSTSSVSNGSNAFADEAVADFSSSRSSVQETLLEEESSGNSFGIGLNIGARLSRKVVLISGLSYLQQNTKSQSNLIDVGASSTLLSNKSELSQANALAFTDPYEITNTYRSLSIPLQAGYYVLDRRFDILLLAGFSNDFFIQRNAVDETGRARGEEFSYQDEGYSLYSVGGLVGSQLSYELGSHYSLAIQPQLRQSFNSYTPNGNKPSSFEVSFKLNYIIK